MSLRNQWKSLAQTRFKFRHFSTSFFTFKQVNPALTLDPSLEALLRDVDISLNNHKLSAPSHRVLEMIPQDSIRDNRILSSNSVNPEFEDLVDRKSPAAIFGSRGIGAVVLPLEMQNSINLLISESDKPALHTDAKRLFRVDQADSENPKWSNSYDIKYRSKQQASRHSERDGTAFASVALPAHYSAILAVLTHVKHRLGPKWTISKVIDWGSGAGSGLWAAAHAFQKNPEASRDVEGLQLSDTTLQNYIGIENRQGLVSIGKRVLHDIKSGDLTVRWQKAFHEDDTIPQDLDQDTIALSAFNLSSQPTNIARKTLVKEMWNSGAQTLILIDHNTPGGFENIAEARELLLSMGRRELDDSFAQNRMRGSHVVAPCPHDHECPLLHPGSMRLVCGFSQRLQRPSFVRLTKHSTVGHEDIGYSYVVIQRGQRPLRLKSQLGRIGAVGKRELDKELLSQTNIKELDLLTEDNTDDTFAEASTFTDGIPPTSGSNPLQLPFDDATQAELRQEAFSWPRLVFAPLKKSGHIILDACTPEGKIMRLTIPKSQGKQPYYDARKSSWGDIFPHEPKNAPQERYQPRRAKREDVTLARGYDIGKRRSDKGKDKLPLSYEALSDSLKETRKKSRRDRLN
ncbi:hypothetical protein D9757_002254 [Collybiopsis confluens]|uniref:Rsm22-domain-containing protein n=1 Tax=Collybiopsis confluens TaxID=2823264 RepID=A0A8H5MG12_9AGAR|nr:hypothetical protein D9757_002254 [Collybiopsis confluens]